MRKLIVSFFLLAAAISCREPLFDPMPRWMHERGNYAREGRQEAAGPGADAYGEEGFEERFPDEYLTAFHFPEGIPWRDSVTTGAELVLYKNGEELLRLPVKGMPEPDRHRVVDGELWTDDSRDGRMTVSCNGVERFSYPGDELYRGFLVLDGKVHTLGQRPGKEGFSYRMDGEEVFSSALGTIVGDPASPDWPGGAFSTDSVQVFYAYALPVRRVRDLDWEYHVMQGDECLETIRAGEVEKLYDIRVFQGEVYRCEQPGASAGSLRVMRGGVAETLGVFDGEEPHACKLVPFNKRLIVKGYSTLDGLHPYKYWYRESFHNLYADSGIRPPLELYRDKEGTVVAVFLDHADEQLLAAITWDKQPLELPHGRFRMLSSRCGVFRDGRFSAALTDADGSLHRVLHATRDSVWVDSYSFNGYFTSISMH